MSIRSARKSTINGRRSSRKSHNKHPSAANKYDIYCINFHDNGLNAVRDELIKQIKIGLRRCMFVIDLDNELNEAHIANEHNQRLTSKLRSQDLPTDRMEITLLRIQNILAEYELVSRKIEAEISFNLLKYYQKNNPAQLKIRAIDAKKIKANVSESKGGQISSKGKSDNAMEKITCFEVHSKEHHKVGKGQLLSKRLYIKDEPSNTSILIVIIGNLHNDFYMELLNKGLPLSGVAHFLPEDSAYDLLVPRPRRKKLLQETIEKIQSDIKSLRKRVATKPVGIFQERLPQMSTCQAVKYSRQIFDQLSWFVYDMQMLREQYEEYYVKPYHEINVKMSLDTSMHGSYQLAKSLNKRGHYLKDEMPMASSDDASIHLYLESLLSNFGMPRELLTELEVLLLANPSSLIQTKVLDKIKVYANAFKSIIKLTKSECLFVEQANTLLSSLIGYMDQKLSRDIYYACLEYNILRRYFNMGYIIDKLHYTPNSSEDIEPQHLPKFGKLYLTADAVTQRILQLIDEHENYKIREIYPSVKLYTFKRGLNEIFEYQKQIVIPTRLCYRDFTLYEMQQFLKDLVTPDMLKEDTDIDIESHPLSKYPSVYTLPDSDVNGESHPYNCRSNRRYSITPSVFIRPKSLKAQRILEQQQERDKMEKEKEKASPGSTLRQSLASNRTGNQTARSTTNQLQKLSIGQTQAENVAGQIKHIGLRPNHPLLTGYNLDNTRQTIKAKTSKYHFEEGLMTLYEEKWNFLATNKCLSIEVDKQVLHLTNAPGKINAISRNIRLETPNGISLRVEPEGEECAKAVLNYPNGLSLYCLDMHAEHLWSDRANELNESRRICTPYGCVIVFYQGNDTVLIMRYNGEVYRLYSYIYPVVEAEEGEVETETDFINACSTLSQYSSFKPLTKHDASVKDGRKKGGSRRKKNSSLKSSTSSGTIAARAAKLQMQQKALLQEEALFASIDAELKYLAFILKLYDIEYKHLHLTTSLGSVVHVEQNRINCDKPIRVSEWHDYFANESYAMRDDGVRLVWTEDSLRCYHSDGTMITTRTIDGWEKGVIEDDIDRQISSSSSHKKFDFVAQESNIMYINVTDDLRVADNIIRMSKISAISAPVSTYVRQEYLPEAEVEDVEAYDYSFATYTSDSHLMQHKLYASTQFNFTHINGGDDLKVMMTKVTAVDNLEFCIYSLPTVEFNSPTRHESLAEQRNLDNHYESLSSDADSDKWTHRRRSSESALPRIKLNPGYVVDINASNLKLTVQEEHIELNAQLRKLGCDGCLHVVRDNIQLKTDFNKSLSIVFRNWVEVFQQFINCFCPKWRTTYFVECLTDDCRQKGIELLKAVPDLGKYNFCAGNYFIDPEEVKSINERLFSHLDYYKEDMAKFPRFATAKKIHDVKFPKVLNTRIFLEIPAQLAYTDRIHLFTYPFDKIKFRKLKHRFNEATLFHLHPHLRSLIQAEISARSWRNRHMENKRRLFLDQQRLSLYTAMLRHKVYPNYFQFKDQYSYHVRNIDFFEFMASKCSDKAWPEPEPEPELSEAPQQAAASKEQKARRKKCLCPKYEKSLQ
ncbi:GH11140 [Drosophila grimshawi]|uniref:GH11140 n=1 Tax=Drosophila grimshawi TaxID=7222 RepID=B4JD85_DROGR|nr:GH11140 [Drosophila grimshawi]